ncbi:uncharacterized protein [Rutidosis leptorrhynchoides]|uniref:uncharacterized protein n=1 Tax=Rutidosis leptorrhynchoides TaxID=125765 RepID=UPI003A99044A
MRGKKYTCRLQVNIDLTHTYGHLRSCPPSFGVGRLRGVRGVSGVATLGRIRGVFKRLDGRVKGAVDIKDYRLWYSGSRIARNGVGIFLGNLHKDNVVDVGRFSDRIMPVSLIIKEETFTVISAYAPHAGLSDAKKKSFWELLDEVVRGAEAKGYEGAHGGFGFGPRNEEGCSILGFAIAHELVIANSLFKNRDAQLATFHSGGRRTQIDFLLLRKGELRTCRDCKVLPAFTCSSQHRLLVMDLVTQGRVGRRARVVQQRNLWKKLHGAKTETFRATVLSVEGDNVAPTDVDQIWNCMVSTIREVAKEGLGVALGTSRAHKRTPAERTRVEERYKEAKREAKKAVAIAKDKAYEDLYRKLDSKEGANDIYRIAKTRERRGRDLVNVKYIKDEAGQSIVREDRIRKRWEENFSSIFGKERTERKVELYEVREYQNNCFCTRINQEKVRSALRKMGRNKAVGPDQIPIEAWRCLGGDGAITNAPVLEPKCTQHAISTQLKRHAGVGGGSVLDVGTRKLVAFLNNFVYVASPYSSSTDIWN